MSHLVLVQQVFPTRAQAEAYFDALRERAWPYAWCSQDPQSKCWKVTAFVESGEFKAVS